MNFRGLGGFGWFQESQHNACKRDRRARGREGSNESDNERAQDADFGETEKKHQEPVPVSAVPEIFAEQGRKTWSCLFHRIAARASIYRSLRVFRARNRKTVLVVVCEKSLRILEKVSKYHQNWTFGTFLLFRVFFGDSF